MPIKKDNRNAHTGHVVGVAIGKRRGESKSQVPYIDLKEGIGVLGDAHAGTEKQVSLVAKEDIDYMNKTYHKPPCHKCCCGHIFSLLHSYRVPGFRPFAGDLSAVQGDGVASDGDGVGTAFVYRPHPQEVQAFPGVSSVVGE